MRVSKTGFDYTSKDYEAFRTEMIRGLQEKIPEYTDTSETDVGIVIIELLAKGLDILSFNQDVQANENFLVTAERIESIMDRCYELGYTPKKSTPSMFKQVFKLIAVRDSDFTIPKGTIVKTKETATEYSVYFETVEDLVIPTGKLGNELDINNNYLYTVDVIQGITIDGELLGSSDGSANQEFKLDYTPVLDDTVTLSINEGYGYELWTRVDTFIDSESTSKHFKVIPNNDGGVTVQFGDGIFGKIPSAYTNGIFAYYRVGGGTDGNVSANSIVELDETIGEIESTFNPSTANTLGTDRESKESIKINAPNHNRTKWGAISLLDHSDLVKEYFDDKIKFVTSMQDATNPDLVNIYVVPLIGSTASTEVKNEIMTFFSMDRQFVGGLVAICDATFQPTNITGNILVDSEYTNAEVQAEVESYITDYFAIGNYDFNTPLYLVDLENSIKEDIEGVRSFRITVPSSDVVTPTQNTILTIGTLSITSSGGK